MTTVSTKASRSRSPCRSEFHPAMKMHTTPRPPPRLTREPTCSRIESGAGNQHGWRRQEQAAARAIAQEAERAEQQHSRIGKCGEEIVPDRSADQRSIASQFAADPLLFPVRQPWSRCWRVWQEAQQDQAQQDAGQALHEEQPLPSPQASHAVKPQQAARDRAHDDRLPMSSPHRSG